jgi:hypothetical protein
MKKGQKKRVWTKEQKLELSRWLHQNFYFYGKIFQFLTHH